MQKKLLITLLTIILIIILTLTLHISFVNASPVIFNMDTLPENQGWTINKTGNATSYVSNGILTIEGNGGNLLYSAPTDWRNTVNFTKGWIVEFRLKLEQSNISSLPPLCYIEMQSVSVLPFAITLYENRITILAPRADISWFDYLMNTTDNFHVYRFVKQANILRVFVDEKLVLYVSDTSSWVKTTLTIDNRASYSNSYWDYFSYDTNPNVTLTSPTLTVVNGTSSYYISNLTGVSVDNSLIPIPNGIYAGWCVDATATMIRNEAHNVVLYSTINSSSPDNIGRYYWSEINYILNHKQGTMQQIQVAIWYFFPFRTTISLNETATWNMINEAKANSNYVPSKGEIMAVLAYAHPYARFDGVQNTILEYRIP